MISVNEISSIGSLQNHDGSICITIAVKYQTQPVFVTLPKVEFDRVGGLDGLNSKKQLSLDFYQKYGAGRSPLKAMS